MRDWRQHIRPRLASLRLSPVREREIVEELAQHLEDRWEELVASGATPEEAANTATTEFNGVRLEALLGSLRLAHCHETPPPGPSRVFSIDSICIDLRHAVRALRATPSFTIGALFVLALGVGATTAIFSVVDAVALRPLPFADPDRLVAVGERTMTRAGPVKDSPSPLRAASVPMGARPGAKPPEADALARIEPQNYLDWVARQRVFESMAAVDDTGEYTLQPQGGELRAVVGHRVTASFFNVLRARPLLGDLFTTRNEVPGSDRVVVLSHRFWQRQLGADAFAVGRMLWLNGEPYEVVGVMAAGFSYPPGAARPADLWLPWAAAPSERVRGSGHSIYLQSIARLKPGVSLAQGQDEMSHVAEMIAAADSATHPGHEIGIRPLRDHVVGTSTRSWMLMLLAAVAIVLVIACANVTSLWLARASVQLRDASVRAALGASRGRLVQRVLIESLIVSVAGTLAGLALAWLCVGVLAAALPEDVARVATVEIDVRVLAVATVAALLTGLAAGIVPALHGSRPALSIVLGESARGGGTSRGRHRVRATLVVAEVALAVVLLVGAVLFIGSFVNVMRVDLGFRSDHVLTAEILPRQILPTANSGVAPPDLGPAFADIVDRARRLPGVVEAAAASPGIPLRVNLWIDALRTPGQPLDPNSSVSIKAVTPGYHRALAIRLTSGRYFTDDDRAGAEAVVILSDTAARMLSADGDVIGNIVEVAGANRRIVGVVGDARLASLEVAPYPEVYLPMAQTRRRFGYVLIRTVGEPNEVLPSLRAVLAQVLPQEPFRYVARMDDLVSAQTAERRLNMLIFGLFGVLGVTIAAVGLFGLLAYLVSQETRNIGIRIALGATPLRVIAGVVGHAGRLVATGLIVGSATAWSLSNLAGRFLFGLDPKDIRAYAVAIITLVVSALVATVMPARRAASINPTEALRKD
jgi:putative ABC transport system permease protein